MAQIKSGLNNIDNAMFGSLQAEKLMMNGNEAWVNEIVTASPSIAYVSKTYTSITWRYTNNDTVPVHIWAKLDDGAYVDLGEVAAGATIDKEFTGLTHNTAHTTTIYAVGTLVDYVASAIIGPSASVTTTQYKTVAPTYVSIILDQTSAQITYLNNDNNEATIHITSNGETKTVVVAAGMTGSVTFIGLTANTAYSVSAYATVAGEITSDTSVVTNYTTESYQTATPSYDSSSVTTTSITVAYLNNDASEATLHITCNGETKTVVAASGATGQVIFTGLSINTSYNVTAYAQATNKDASDVTAATAISTNNEVTATPSYYSRSVGTTTAYIYYKNNDGSTANIYVTINGVTKTISNVAPGANGYAYFSGLSADTSYSVSAYAIASGEDPSAVSATTTFSTDPYTTATPSYYSRTVGTTSATIRYQNNDGSTATIYITCNGETKFVSVASGGNGGVTFTGLTANTLYDVSAYAQASGETVSATSATTSFTTDKYTTATPSFSHNSLITTTSARVYYTNNDASTATIYITVNGVTNSVSVGAGQTGYAYFSGLTPGATYTSSAYAQASGEDASASTSAGGSFTTLVKTATPSFVSRTTFQDTCQVIFKNEDASTATLYITIDGGDLLEPYTLSVSGVASNANDDVIFTNLGNGTYTISAYALASGKASSDSASGTSFTISN